jgi:nonsense-mediated mRNA decay protein 3
MVDFIKHKIACTALDSKKLISQDFTNNTVNYKYSIMVDLIPLCKDDLVALPKPLSRLLGGIGPLCIVYKVSTSVHLVDVVTM